MEEHRSEKELDHGACCQFLFIELFSTAQQQFQTPSGARHSLSQHSAGGSLRTAQKIGEQRVIWPNAEVLWRQSSQDGIFSIPAALVQAGNAADALYIGSRSDLNVKWEHNQHFTWAVDGAHFFSGAFLHETTSGKNVNFFAPSISHRF
jgi:hypothetical protein